MGCDRKARDGVWGEVWANRTWQEGEQVLLRLGKRRNTNREVVQGELCLWRMKDRWAGEIEAFEKAR